MPRSSRRLLDPQDHGSLEYITLHPQLVDVLAQLVQLGPLVNGEAFPLAPLNPLPVHPIAQGARVDPQIPGHLSDRLARLTHDPHSPLTELGSYFLRISDMTSPHSGSLHGLRGYPDLPRRFESLHDVVAT